MHIRPPLQYDSLDIDNPRQPPPQNNKKDWKVLAVILFMSIIIFIIFLGIVVVIHNKLDVITNTSYTWQRDVAILFKWVLYGSPVVIISLIVYHTNYLLRYVVKRVSLINLMDVQTTIDNLAKLGIGYSYLDIMKERAKQSKFAGVQTLTWDSSNSTPDVDVPIEEKTIEEFLPPANDPILIALRQQGYINRSNNSILLGFGKDES